LLGHVVKGSGRSYIHGARLVEGAGALWRWNNHLERILGETGADHAERVTTFLR
jgi:hypothetical protein